MASDTFTATYMSRMSLTCYLHYFPLPDIIQSIHVCVCSFMSTGMADET